MPRTAFAFFVLALSLANAPRLLAADTYFAVDLQEEWFGDKANLEALHKKGFAQARLRIDGPGEAALIDNHTRYQYNDGIHPPFSLAARAPAGEPLKGRLFLTKSTKLLETLTLNFEIPAQEGRDEHRRAFLEAKARHLQDLLNRDVPGAAWFRHQLQLTENELGRKLESTPNMGWWRRGRRGPEDTLDLFTGGRAIAENLQLTRRLGDSLPDVPTVDIDSIKGITVREFDWKPLVKGLKPKLDPLATLIPEDQHAIFFPSFTAMTAVADKADFLGTQILRGLEPKADDARSKERYERQLCLPMSALSRVAGPTLVKSVAITGGDPYLPTGTDIAIIFEARSVPLLRTALESRMAMAAKNEPTAQAIKGGIGDTVYYGYRSPDRTISTYITTLGEAVVVTNSIAQLERLVEVHRGLRGSLAKLDEYTFFRDRYKLGEGDESAFVMLSDATIRRWCSARWRIGNSRRTRSAAVMAQAQAEHFDELTSGKVKERLVASAFDTGFSDEITLTAAGMRSKHYGTLDYQFPISELPLTKVTTAERDLYVRWRDGYQNNWTGAFDPIGVRLSIKSDKLATDVTVMPLIGNSQYNFIAAFARDGKIERQTGDLHPEALVHLAVGFDGDKSHPFIGDAFKWAGSSVALYVDDDPELVKIAKELARGATPDSREPPIVLRIDRKESKEVSFDDYPFASMVGDKKELIKYRGFEYAALTNSKTCAAITPKAVFVTLHESSMKRVLDRLADETAGKVAKKPERTAPGHKMATRDWLGDHLCLRFDRRAISALDLVLQDIEQTRMQELAWNNLPILNEWKKLYPDRDPVALHEQFWQVRLACPGGGKYVWNAEDKTMESTVYGHPLAPKRGPTVASLLGEIDFANFGVTFEEHGLRAKAELDLMPGKTR